MKPGFIQKHGWALMMGLGLMAMAAGQDPNALAIPPLRVESSALKSGQPIPKMYTADGEDISPPLTWSKAPAGTVEYALICDDPNAPTPKPWVHWVIYKIPSSCQGLPQGMARSSDVENPKGAFQGKNSWPKDNIGYRGPAPPPGHGVHHYHFRLYALDRPIMAVSSLDKDALLKAMEGHILGQAELVATYQR